MYVCVGGVLFMGKLQSSAIWLIYRLQLPHLTVRIEADEITGSLIQTNSHTSAHIHLHMHGHTLNNAGNATELAARLNGFS